VKRRGVFTTINEEFFEREDAEGNTSIAKGAQGATFDYFAGYGTTEFEVAAFRKGSAPAGRGMREDLTIGPDHISARTLKHFQ
jgi:hypothetical protein